MRSPLALHLAKELSIARSAIEIPGDLPAGLRTDHGIRAAVLIAITDRVEPGVILTVRREHLRTHGGQIAFPGGCLERGEDPIAAALREAKEEVKIDSSLVDVAGVLNQHVTITGYLVTPVIGVVPPDLPLQPQETEVSEWFEAPLGYLLSTANHRWVCGLFRGEPRHYYEIVWNGRRIWGATAAMIVNLSGRLRRT